MGEIDTTQLSIKIDKGEDQLLISKYPTSEIEEDKQLCLVKRFPTPAPEEIFNFINDGNGYIEGVFKCMIREISNSKLNMVKNGAKIPSIYDDDNDDDKNKRALIHRTNSSVDVINMIQNLDYFVDILFNIKSSDVKETFNIIVLYERMIFDLRSEISSLKNRLKIFKTILAKR